MIKIGVFISSKMQELASERQALHDFFAQLSTEMIEFKPWIFEIDAPASNSSIQKIYLDALSTCQIYIGLFWLKYGEWTIDEFNNATERGIERHIYVKDVDGEQREAPLTDFLNSITPVQTGLTTKWFKDTNTLLKAVDLSINVWLEQYLSGEKVGEQKALLLNDRDDVPNLKPKLIGRDTVIECVKKRLQAHEQVLLAGFRGIGKTVLAAEITAQIIDEQACQALWISMGDATAETIFESIGHTLSALPIIMKEQGEARKKAVRKVLRAADIRLVVIDDARNGSELHRLFEALPHQLAVLVTSYNRFALRYIEDVEELAYAEAIKLISYYAGGKDYSNQPELLSLCQKLDYHTYALEIAGSRLQVDKLSPAELLQQIADTPHDLKIPLGFSDKDYSSVGQMIAISLSTLDDTVRDIFMAIGGLFTRSFSSELLALALGKDVNSALDELFRRSLIRRVKHSNQHVYEMHSLAYSYVRTAFMEAEKSPVPFIAACVQYVEKYPQEIELLQQEIGNLLGAAQTARQLQDNESLKRIIIPLTLDGYLDNRGHTPTYVALLDRVIERLETDKNDLDLHYLLGKRGNIHYNLGEIDAAFRIYRKALDFIHALDNPLSRHVRVLGVISKTLTDLKDFDQAEQYLNEAQSLAGDNPALRIIVLENRGYHAQASGNHAKARDYFVEELAIAEPIEDVNSIFFALNNLGEAERHLKNYDASKNYLERGRELAIKEDNFLWQGMICEAFGHLYHDMTNPNAAASELDQALELYRKIGEIKMAADVIEFMKTNNYWQQ